MKRISSVDFIRGFVMIIMALDHVRDLIHFSSIDPADISATNPALFFTRWITHLCAPTFVFLSGVSAFLSFNKKSDTKATRRFLFSRGLWLIFLEFTIVNFGLWFDPGFHTIIFQVIGAIGFGFILLGLMTGLSSQVILATGLAIIFTHNLWGPLLPPAFALLANPSAFPIAESRLFIMGYPPLPWLGIMLTGFGCGRFFIATEAIRKKNFLTGAALLLSLFILLRFVNVFGDPAPWSSQKNTLYTFMSFMNVSKYPPSLLFVLATLGVMSLIAWLTEGKKGLFYDIISVYGKVPLFYFVIHFYVIHLVSIMIISMQGYGWAQIFSSPLGKPEGAGISLPMVYVFWICLLISLYPLCRWYGKYKAENPEKRWLRYL